MGCVGSKPDKINFVPPRQPPLEAVLPIPTPLGPIPPLSANPVLCAVPQPQKARGASTSNASSSKAQFNPRLENVLEASFELHLSVDKVLNCTIHTNPQQKMIRVWPELLKRNPALLAPYALDFNLARKSSKAGSYSKFFLATTKGRQVFACLKSDFDCEDIIPPFFPGQNKPLSQEQKEVVNRFLANPIAIKKLPSRLNNKQSSGSESKIFPFFSVYNLAMCDVGNIIKVLFFVRLDNSLLFGFNRFLDGFLSQSSLPEAVIPHIKKARDFLENKEKLASVYEIILGLAAQILEATSSAQENGFVFGDIKPPNLLVYLESDLGSEDVANLKIADLWGAMIINQGNGSQHNAGNPRVSFSTIDYLPKKTQKETSAKPCFELDAHAVGLSILQLLLGNVIYKLELKKILDCSEFFENHPLKELFSIAKGLLFQHNLENLKTPNTSKPICKAFVRFKKTYGQSDQNTAESGVRVFGNLAAVSGVAAKKLTVPNAQRLATLLTPLAPLYSSKITQAAWDKLATTVGNQGKVSVSIYLRLLDNLFKNERAACSILFTMGSSPPKVTRFEIQNSSCVRQFKVNPWFDPKRKLTLSQLNSVRSKAKDALLMRKRMRFVYAPPPQPPKLTTTLWNPNASTP